MRLSQTTYRLVIIWKKKLVIVKFKCRKLKQRVLSQRKNLRNKSEDSTIRFSGKLFISESMCHENHQLAYKCHQLKNAGKIHFTWFCNNAVNIKLSEISNPVNIFNIIDTENFLALTVWMILLVTLHFNWSHLLLCCFFLYFLSLI